MMVSLRCHGEYSYIIVDPILFYTNICGNVSDRYVRSSIDSQLKSELMTKLQPALNKLSEMDIPYFNIPGHVDELADALAQQPVVVRDKHFQHAGSPPSQFSGISNQTAVPALSFVRICRPFVILK